MSDFFEEVEEGLRQDRATQLWTRYGPFVWVAAIALVAFVAWREYSAGEADRRQARAVTTFEEAVSALEGNEYAAAEADLTSLAASDNPIAPLAGHLLAQVVYEGNGDVQAAIARLEDVVSAQEGEGVLSDLALLKTGYLAAENASLSDLETRLAPLIEKEGAFGALALELIAAKAFADGDLVRAREEFGYLRFAANVPPGVVQRAEQALSVIPLPGVPIEAEPEAPADQSEDPVQ